MAIVTTLGQVAMALRAHHQDPNTEEKPTANERPMVGISAIESARLWLGVDVALRVRETLDGKSDEEWWQHKFLLHPNVLQFLHHRLDGP